MADEDRLPTWCGDEGWSPVVVAAAVLERKWHPVIVHRLVDEGPLTFGELEESIGSVSGKVLSESLTDLEDKGLVERTVIDDKPVHVEYSLTTAGRGLEDAVVALRDWGAEYLEPADSPEDSIV